MPCEAPVITTTCFARGLAINKLLQVLE
jgi:hypothetical protein